MFFDNFFDNLKLLPWTAWQSGCDPFVIFVPFVVPKKTFRNSLIQPILSPTSSGKPYQWRVKRKLAGTKLSNKVPEIVFRIRDKTPIGGQPAFRFRSFSVVLHQPGFGDQRSPAARVSPLLNRDSITASNVFSTGEKRMVSFPSRVAAGGIS